MIPTSIAALHMVELIAVGVLGYFVGRAGNAARAARDDEIITLGSALTVRCGDLRRRHPAAAGLLIRLVLLGAACGLAVVCMCGLLACPPGAPVMLVAVPLAGLS